MNSGLRRRQVFLGAAGLAGATVIGIASADQDTDKEASVNSSNLAPTKWIDSNHPRVVELAKAITKNARTPRESAVRVHDWVRDHIAFGIAPAFYAMKASDVLQVGVGYCNTKTTLFSALLRASGIPTRTRMFDLSAEVLRGLFDPGTTRVDHAVTEVWLEGGWIGVDSYVVDLSLARSARALLSKESRQAGYGVHLAGSSAWDGRSASRIQCVEGDVPAGWVGQDHGIFEDVCDFYARVPVARNRLNLITGLLIRLGSSRINRDIEAVRHKAPKP